MQRIAVSNGWKVKPPSKEYLNLAPEVRSKIDEYLAEYPVKLGAIAKRLGVKVLLSTLPRGISIKISLENGGFVIRVNRHEAKRRQRFTLAHALSHVLLHRDRIEAEREWLENVLMRTPNQPEEIEHEANRLAFDIVIPSQHLVVATAEYSGPMTTEVIDDLALRFGVTKATMEIKLQIM